MKKCIVTGAAGFTGYSLVEKLIDHGYFVYAVVRPQSEHNVRLEGMRNVQLVQAYISEYGQLDEKIKDPCDAFFHLAWQGGGMILPVNTRILSIHWGHWKRQLSWAVSDLFVLVPRRSMGRKKD